MSITDDIYLEKPVEIPVLLVRPSWVPEHVLIWIVEKYLQPPDLNLAPGDGVGGPAGAVVHGRGSGWLGGYLPAQHTQEVDTHVHWYYISHTRPPVAQDPR